MWALLGCSSHPAAPAAIDISTVRQTGHTKTLLTGGVLVYAGLYNNTGGMVDYGLEVFHFETLRRFIVLPMSDFEWTDKKELAALSLARGDTQESAADMAGVTGRTIRRWLLEPEFSEEVDRLTLMVEIASRAHRIRIANRVIRQFVKDGEEIATGKDLLDWLKYAQGETDGVKLDMTALVNAYRNQVNE